MKKAIIAPLIFGVSLACLAVTVANAPILFKGIDDVPLESVCSSDFGSDALGAYKMCKPRIEEYAGEELIHKRDNDQIHYSFVEYDPVTRKITSINFLMNLYSYGRIKQVLEAKYGSPQKSPSTGDTEYWYGDAYGETMIYISKFDSYSHLGRNYSGGTQVVIITAAMRKARKAFEDRQDRERQERKAKAVKGL